MFSHLNQDKARLMRMATYASTSVAISLIIIKLVAWFMTGSVSILATLMDSCLDALASILNLFAVHHALAPADKEHRFGHGKAEALSGLGQATFITGSALFLVLEAASHLLNPEPITAMSTGIWVMIISIIATMGLLMFQKHVIKQTDSTAIKADHMHYKTDLVVNIGVVVALLLTFYGWPGFDPLFAIAIAAFILYSAWEIAKESLDLLMDRELPDEERSNIESIVQSHPKTHGMHDLRTRKSGTTTFIQLHLELDDHLTLLQAHAISDEVEALLLDAYPDAEVIIHEDPASLKEPTPEFAS